jgi:hypothetical protein
MIDTLKLEDFQNDVEEYLYRVRTGKLYLLKEKGTSRTWLIKPYVDPKMVTINIDLEPETIKKIQEEAKKKRLTFDQMVAYILLKHMDARVAQPKKVKRSIPRKTKPSLKPKKVKRSAWRK